jgi:UPF0755 protein
MKKIFFILFLVLIAGIIGFSIFIKSNLSALSSDTKNKVFVINTGDGIIDISKSLEKNKLIKNKIAFMTYVFITGQNKKIQSGTFRLSPSLSVPEIIKKLSSGGVSDFWLKIIEGSRLEEIAPLFPQGLPTTAKEGYLFPDSYLIPLYFTSEQTLEVISQNFTQKFTQAKKDSTSTLTDEQNLILASLLEREGRSLESKKMIAGILLNRLKIGMALQVDASVQYARDSRNKDIKDYWQPVSKSDLSINSPYNTYKNPGLPPKPICNPGYNSLYAVFHPTASDYLFYITGNDNQMHYAKTLDEHNSNIAKYLK